MNIHKILFAQKQWLIWLIICLKGTGLAHAQWTPQDSIWLKNVLSGKDSLQLNPETMKAIQSGSLLNLEMNPSEMITAPAELPVLKDFSSFLQLDEENENRIVPLEMLPPMVFRLYQVKLPESEYTVSKEFYNAFGEVVKWARKPGGYDFVHALNYAFSKQYRQYAKNKVRARGLVRYNDMPTVDEAKQKKQFLEQQQNLPLPFVVRRDTTKVVKSTSQASLEPDSISVEAQVDSLLNKMPQH